MSNRWMMKTLWTDLCDFFFPRICVGCGRKLLADEDTLCLQCLSGLPRTRILNTPGNEMERRLWSSPLIQRASSIFFYAKGGVVSKILQGMKYQGKQKLCRKMGRLIAVELLPTGFFAGIDYLLPVPLHPARQRQRGYNQSELLALGIAEKTGIQVASGFLVRTHNNTTQTHKSSAERWQNTQNLFASTSSAKTLIHRHVLLVDDVFTTGSTMAACIDALSGIEGLQVSIVTLAYAK